MATDTATSAPDGTPAPAAEGEKAKRQLNGVYVSTPKDLREKIEAEAKGADQSVAGFVRNLLAQRYGITIEATPVRRKYATDEEKKEALKSQRKDRQAMIKEALELLRAKKAAEAEAAKAVAPSA